MIDQNNPFPDQHYAIQDLHPPANTDHVKRKFLDIPYATISPAQDWPTATPAFFCLLYGEQFSWRSFCLASIHLQLLLDIYDCLFPSLGSLWEHRCEQWETVNHPIPDM